jgi:hypothetical protein
MYITLSLLLFCGTKKILQFFVGLQKFYNFLWGYTNFTIFCGTTQILQLFVGLHNFLWDYTIFCGTTQILQFFVGLHKFYNFMGLHKFYNFTIFSHSTRRPGIMLTLHTATF